MRLLSVFEELRALYVFGKVIKPFA